MTPRQRMAYLAALVVTALCVLLDLHSLWVIRRRERTINEILNERGASSADLATGRNLGPTGDGPADLEALRAELAGEE